MSSWRECKLGELGTVVTGKTPSSKNPEDWGFEMPFVTPSDYKNYGKFALSSERNLSKDGISRLQNKILPENSIMVTCIGSDMGKVAMNKIPVITNQQINSIIPDSKIVDNNFLYYRLVSLYEILRVYGSDGTAVPIVNKTDFENMPISLPPLEEQKAIAEVLGSLDEKIDFLHRQNKTLEELAQTLFRQWFVEEAADDWKIGTLNDIMQFNPTHSLKKGEMHPFLEMGNVQTFKSSVVDWYKRAFTSGTKFKNGDTLLARITPSLENGKTAYVDFLEGDEIGWGSTEFIVMRMKKDFHPFISYLIARNEDFRDFAIGNMTGSTGRQRAQAKDIKEYEIAIPPIEIIQKLNESIKHIPIKIRANAKQIKTLENMRDTLLPKLLSGEVRVEI